MAAYINEQLKDMTRCCICTEAYSDPRILSCIHTFCLHCLEQVGKQSGKNPGDRVPCPVCRKEFVIPDQGMVGIQKNFFMDNLVEMTKIGNPHEKTSCDFCLEDLGKLDGNAEDLPLATGCCIDCHENLCDDCSTHHRKQKPTRNHQIVPLGSEVFPRQVAALKSCNQHSNEHLKIYCFHCKTVVCVLCFVESHKSHECTDIHRVSDDLRQKIGQDAQKMSQLLAEGETRMRSLEKVRTDVNRKADSMEGEMRVRAEDLKALIDQHLQLQLGELSKRKQSMLKGLEVDQNETKQHICIVDSFQTYCSEVTSKGSPGDVCASANDLHTRSDELLQLHQSRVRVPVAEFNCSFCKMELEDILDLRNNNILGCIKDTTATVKLETLEAKATDAGNKGNVHRTNQQQQNCRLQPVLQHTEKQAHLHAREPAPKEINNPSFAFPLYWKHKRGDGSACQTVQIDRGEQLYRELESMFTRVLGNNSNPSPARQLGCVENRPRKISNIWSIENTNLYGKYAEKKEALCANAMVNTYRPLSSVLGSEVVTLKKEFPLVNSTLDRRVNEYFLFHDASLETWGHVSRMGFSTLGECRRNLAALKRIAPARTTKEKRLGSTAICFRETLDIQDDFAIGQASTKHATYVRMASQSPRYVFLARVLLGNSYLCQRPKVFKRTPCMHKGCYSDSCDHHTYAGSFDSVVVTTQGGHQSDSEDEGCYDKWENARPTVISSCDRDRPIRDFLIYSPEQSYPDFLIEYQ